jgi:hypothetical protein
MIFSWKQLSSKLPPCHCFLGDFFDISKFTFVTESNKMQIFKNIIETTFWHKNHQKRKLFRGEYVLEIFLISDEINLAFDHENSLQG